VDAIMRGRRARTGGVDGIRSKGVPNAGALRLVHPRCGWMRRFCRGQPHCKAGDCTSRFPAPRTTSM